MSITQEDIRGFDFKGLRSSEAEQWTVNPSVGISKFPASAKGKKVFFEIIFAALAQLVVHLICNQKVNSSSLLCGSPLPD